MDLLGLTWKAVFVTWYSRSESTLTSQLVILYSLCTPIQVGITLTKLIIENADACSYDSLTISKISYNADTSNEARDVIHRLCGDLSDQVSTCVTL